MSTKYRLNQEFIDFLSDQPETGMGYQVVDVRLKDGRIFPQMVVLNSTFLVMEDPAQFSVDDIDQITIK